MNPFDIQFEAEISQPGVRRLRQGHLWVYAGDVIREPMDPGPPIVKVVDSRHHVIGYAFYSKFSQIRLRLVTQDEEPPNSDWFRSRIQSAIQRRQDMLAPGRACRLIFGEADLLPSMVVDRYDDYLVLQTLSCAADALKPMLVDSLRELLAPIGVLERNDVKTRLLEGLTETKGVLWGSVPERVEISEGGIHFWVDLIGGQKTGFFLDQSENRIAARNYARGHGLDCFTNTGGFALHFAQRCDSVIAVDTSRESLDQARRNAKLNGIASVDFLEGNTFDFLRERERAGERFDIICLDPPAFAKNRDSLPTAKAGYKEINLRAMKLLKPDGILVTSSCSYHLSEPAFFDLLQQAARDAHRYVQVLERRAQAKDHPILAGMPETHYLKCFILRVL